MIIAGAATLIMGAASAHEHATGVVAERMTAMKTMETELNSIQAMLSGVEQFDLARLRDHVATLHDNCHRTGSLFPAGSLDRHSHARAAVWSEPERFRQELQKLHEASEALVETVADGDRAGIAVATADLGKTCEGCHAIFRKPE